MNTNTDNNSNINFFIIPEFCPACSGPTSEEGDFLYCNSRACPAKLSGSVKVWIKRQGILHWGDALVDALTDPNNLKILQIGDIYRLTVEDIAECCSGEKVAQKCYDELHKDKSISLEMLIASLNIPNLAISTATDIVHAGFDTVDKIFQITYDDLVRIPNIGEKTARAIFDGLSEKRSILVDLASVLDVRAPVIGALTGKSICITGSTSKPRKAVQKDILEAGGIVKESVGKGLTYLVTNETTMTTKMQKAIKYGTRVISENDLYTLISGGVLPEIESATA